jgi:hypothetical protein
MRRRAIVGFMAVLTASALVVGMSVGVAGAAKKSTVAVCAGKTKPQAVKQIKKAYKAFLDGSLGYTAEQKAPYIQYLSGKNVNQAFFDQFKASSEANAASAATTSVDVDKVKCVGKKGKKANVAFTLVIGGQRSEGLAPPGQAILDGKQWKVTALTLCNLQALGDPTVLENPPCSDFVAAG